MPTVKHWAGAFLIAFTACSSEPENDEERIPNDPLPGITAVFVSGGPTLFDAFACRVVDARFSNPLTASAIRWIVNEKPSPMTGATLTHGYAPGDALRCEAQVTFDQNIELPVTSTAVTVLAPSAFLLRNTDAPFLSVRMEAPTDAGRTVLCGGALVDEHWFAAALLADGFQLSPPLYIAADYSCKTAFLENETSYVFGWGMGFSADATGVAMFTLGTAAPELLSAKRFAAAASSAILNAARPGHDGFILAGQTHPGANGWLASLTRQGQFLWQYSFAQTAKIDDVMKTPDGYFLVGMRDGLPWLAKFSATGLPTSEVTLAGTFDSRGEASIAAIEGGYLIAYDELVITANAAGVPTSVAWRDGVQNFDILSFADQRWITDMSGATNYSGLSSDRLHFTPSGNPSINYAWPSKLAVYDDGVWLSGQIDEPFNGSYIPEHAFFYRLTPDVVGALSTAAPFSVARESTTFTDAAVTTYPVTSSVTATNFAWEAFSPRTQIGAKWAVEVLAPTPQD